MMENMHMRIEYEYVEYTGADILGIRIIILRIKGVYL